jgi:hypothetical protein
MKLLRDFAGKQISDQDYKNLYGAGALEVAYTLAEADPLYAADDPDVLFEAGGFQFIPERENEYKYKDLPGIEPVTKPMLRADSPNSGRLIERKLEEAIDKKKQLIMQNKVLEEYLLGLQQRFVPFRRYHLVTSDTDIVHNGIISSNSRVGNAVSVMYTDPNIGAEEMVTPVGVTEMKASNFIPEQEIQMVPVSYPNCRGYSMSLRYGLGTLLYTMREMYRGELMVLGNPRIRPWDICVLRDEYNDMIGPVEVEAVVHMFSHETGFLTEIKPNAVVMSNEISSYPVLSALQTMMMTVEDNKKSKSRMNLSTEDSESILYNLVKPGESEEMRKRYSSIFNEGFSLDEIFPNFNKDNAEQIRAGLDAESLEGFASLKNGLADIASTGIFVGSMITGAAVMGSVGLGVGVAARNVGKISSASNVLTGAKGIGAQAGLIAGSGVGGGLAGAGAGTVAGFGGGYAINSAVRSGSLQWFIAAPILFAKCLEEEVISIMPLTKNGVPMVSGLSLKDPAMMWRNVFGRLYNYATDTAVGLQDLAWMWEISGDNWWETFVAYSSEGGLYQSVRDDYTRAAGGQ